MIRCLLAFILFVLNFQLAVSQNIVPYKEGRLCGLKNESNNEIVVSARFNSCVIFNDSLFIVKSHSAYGVINSKGDTIVPFTKDEIFKQKLDSTHFNDFFEISTKYDSITKSHSLEKLYIIDRNRNCITSDYYPCPDWKKTTSPIPDYLKYIQQGEKFVENNEIDSALQSCVNSVRLAPNNPYPFYWGCNVLLNKNYYAFKYDINSEYSRFDSVAAFLLKKADSLENRRYYKLRINTLRYNFYKFHDKSRRKRKEIMNRMKEYNPYIEKSGLFLITGFEYSFDPYLEIGFGNGSFALKSHEIHAPIGFIGYGLSYLKSLNKDKDIDALKLYLISIHNPLRVGLCFFAYSNFDKSSIVFRPELGYTIKRISLTYGYNLYPKNSFINNECHSTFTLRYFIPIKTYVLFYD